LGAGSAMRAMEGTPEKEENFDGILEHGQGTDLRWQFKVPFSILFGYRQRDGD